MVPPAPANGPPPDLPNYLRTPTPRGLVGRGLDLVLAATLDLRPPSLVVALQFAATVWPLVMLVVVVVVRIPDLIDLLTSGEPPGRSLIAAFSLVYVAAILAALGAMAMLVEGQAIAIAVLGARLAGRPLSFVEALARSRQSFWRLVGAGILVFIPLTSVSTIGDVVLDAGGEPAEWKVLAVAAVVAVIGIPVGNIATGIVHGDVGPREAAPRTFRHARAAKGVAIVLAMFAFVFSVLAQFAILAGGDIVLRAGQLLGLTLDGSPIAALATYLVILVAVIAAGSLIFTVNAIIVAPQVVAFIGLTHVDHGLDRAREAVAASRRPPPMPAASSSAWAVTAADEGRRVNLRIVTIPMLLLVIGSMLVLIAGLVAIAGVG
jgi:hypothetical protein